MNTVMAQAMQAAGMSGKPIPERIWLWLRDHPRATALTLATELNESESSIRTALSKLKARGQIKAVVGPPVRSPRSGNLYRALEFTALGDEYEAPLHGRGPKTSAPPAPVPASASGFDDVLRIIENMRFADVIKLRRVLNEGFQ